MTVAAPPTGPTPGFLVWRLSMKWRAAVDRAVAPLGLTHAQYSSARVVARPATSGPAAEPARARRLHRARRDLRVEAGTALEAGGLVDRASDPTDTPAVRLSLSRKGIDVIDRAVIVVRDLLEHLTAPLGGTAGKRTAC